MIHRSSADIAVQVYLTTRGRELPGNYNHTLLTELFHVQSKRWGQLALKHVESVHKDLEDFVRDLAKYVAMDARMSG